MEIPMINFEASISSLHNPSFLTRIFSLFELGKLSQAQRIWKFVAFLLALVYAFNYVANKLKVIILHYHNKSKSFLSKNETLLTSTFDDELYTSDEEDDDVSISSADEEDDMEYVNKFSYDDLSKFAEDFSTKGRKCKVLRRRRSIGDNFSLSDLVCGDGVVKLWDGVERSLSFLDLTNISAVSMPMSPAVFLSAAAGEAGLLGLSLWDLRCSRKEPEVHATWRLDRNGSMVGAGVDRTGSVYVRDGVTKGLTVGDLRKAEKPVAEFEDEDLDMWWDTTEMD